MSNKKIGILIGGIFLLLIIIFFLVFGSTQKISEIKDSKYVGKNVKVKGIVENTIKIGPISGYTLNDKTGSISISSQNLPIEGEEMTVKGILMKDTILGYYIKID